MSGTATDHAVMDWDTFWRDRPNFGDQYGPIFTRAAQIVGLMPCLAVHEYGFGGLRFARLIGPASWRGHDIASAVVDGARAAGFVADRVRCGDATVGVEIVCAFNVLSHLSECERGEFLGRARAAPFAVFSDRRWAAVHLRTPGAFERYLCRYWTHVAVETVRIGRKEYFLARCSVSGTAHGHAAEEER